MQKVLRCNHCRRAMKLCGSTGFGKGIARVAICPYCNNPVKVSWPKGDDFRVMGVASR